MMSVESSTHFTSRDHITRQVSAWWVEAESAIHASQRARARRFLRWILAACPDDEEAWLWLARLASTYAEELAYLQQAQTFHPESLRTATALREARTRQLEAGVSGLCSRRGLARCLPDQRCNGHHPTTPQNGKAAPPSGLRATVRRARLKSFLNLL